MLSLDAGEVLSPPVVSICPDVGARHDGSATQPEGSRIQRPEYVLLIDWRQMLVNQRDAPMTSPAPQ